MNPTATASDVDDGRLEVVAAGWMLGAAAKSLVVVGPNDEIEVEVEATPDVRPLVDLFASGASVPTVARASGLAVAEAEELMAELRVRGALTQAPTVPEQTGIAPLHQALGTPMDQSRGSAELICTADELLILPKGLDIPAREIALRSFVAGLEPWGRLRAYARLAVGDGRICGDLPLTMPPPSAVDLERLIDPTVINLRTGEVSECTRAELVDRGFNRTYRLGSLCREYPPQSLEREGIADVWYTVANLACIDLSRPTPPLHRRVQGSGDREHSQLSARAEGAERFAVQSAQPNPIRVARAVDLRGTVVLPEDVIAFNRRQMRSDELAVGADPDAPRPWLEAQGPDGGTSWIDASIVYPHLAGWPSYSGTAARLTASSGVAAHSSPHRARASALAELVERDAFMWTWIQHVTREQIDRKTAPPAATRWADALARRGWMTHWVNLTLESWPVILCCLVRPEGGLVVGTACRMSPADALLRATQEAMVVALRFNVSRLGPIAAEDVRHPIDHLRLWANQPPEAAEFLYSAETRVALDDLPSGASFEHQLADVGIDVHFADLTSDQTAPFHVVRAFAPGLVPLTFGYDREPLGMAILGRPRRTSTGTSVGRALDLSDSRMSSPHPFA